MNLKNLLFFLALTSLMYACQNTTQPEKSPTQYLESAMKEGENPATPATSMGLADTPILPNAYVTGRDIDQPLESSTIPFKVFSFSPQQAQTLKMPVTGSTIEIPANVFVDENGNQIVGKVDIKFREYHDVGDIITSGIPMRMKAPDGSSGYMQSAGMYEIQGSSEGKSVFIKEGENITVNLTSDYGDKDAVYDFWSFKQGEKAWVNKGKSNARPNPAKQTALKRIAKVENTERPIKPYKFDKNKPVLNFDINLTNLPELKQMNGILWQYAGDDDSKDPTKNNWVLTEQWDKAEIEPFPNGNLYRLKLSNTKKSFVTTVCPSQSGEEFSKSMQEYASIQKEYEANKVTKEQLVQLAADQKSFVRSARLDGFGIYNYDFLLKDDDAILVNAQFDFGVKIPGINNFAKVYMIMDNRNVVCYPNYDWSKFRINPEAETRMVALLPGGKYATISESEFKKIMPSIREAEGMKYTFKMTYPERIIASLEEMKNIISNLA